MDNKKIDITSTVLEKGIDTAKNFLDKLVMPSIEEIGLLIKDQVTLWKFNNQVRMLNKAKTVCEKNNISPKTISLKVLCPLLDYSALEEDEVLHDKWAILLANMVDSEQNIENHVFPYIISQVSSNEFLILDKIYDDKINRVNKLTIELLEFQRDRPKIEEELKTKIDEQEKKVQEAKVISKSPFTDTIWELQREKRKFEQTLNSLKYREGNLKHSILKLEEVPFNVLKEFEVSNLIRLGLVKEEKEFYANRQTLEIPNDKDDTSSYISVDLDIDVDSDVTLMLTELGELFIAACKEKKNSHQY